MPSVGEAGVAFLAGAGNALGLLAFYRAASVGPLSIAAPLGSLGALIPVMVGVAQGEILDGLKLAAIALAMTGVALAARRGTPPGAVVEGPNDRRAAAGWALVSSVGFGVFLAGMAPAADAGIFWAVALSRLSLLAIFVAVAVRVASPLRVGGRDVPRVMVPGLLLFGGTLLYTAATREGDLVGGRGAGVAVPGRHGRVGVRPAGRAADARPGRGRGRGDDRVGVARRVALNCADSVTSSWREPANGGW